jgi:hypothetical protein
MKLLTILILSFFFFSCSGSEIPEAAHEHEREKEDVHAQPDMQTENMLTGSPNCSPPNVKFDPNSQKFCGTADCLIEFAGYWWWTNYHYIGSPSYYWQNEQKQAYSPRNAWVDNEGIHLTVKKDDLGGGSEWMSSEVVAVFKGNKQTLAQTGYGTYLISAKIKSASSWTQLDRNVAFGVFTFDNATPSNSIRNKYRELDLAEVSKWGVPPCSNALIPKLCEGNAQFTLQPWDALADAKNIHRYAIADGVNEITLVMIWNGANQPVTFSQYNGLYNLNNLPSSANNSFTTTADQNPFIPDNGCQLVHLNLWMGNYGEGGPKHPGPSNGQTQHVVVTNFQYAGK